MKKSLLALAAAIVLLGLILFMNKRNAAESGKGQFAFDTSQYTQMGSLWVASGADTSRLEVKDGQWVVAKDGWLVDTAKIHKVVKALYGIQSGDMVSNNPARATEYGLDSATGKSVSWKDKSGKEVAKVIVGKTSSADFSSTYWKYADKPEVFSTPGNFTWEIAARDEDWKQRRFFPGSTLKDLQFVEVTWKDSLGVAYNYRLEAVNDTTWRMLSPAPNPVKRKMAEDIYNRVLESQVDDFMLPNDTNKTKVALDSPVVVIKTEFKGGKASEMKISKTLDTYTYVLHPHRADTVRMGSWRFDMFKKKPFELIEPVVDTAKVDSAAIVTDPKAVSTPAAP
jgi:Domain of unknown function (DUF4340)